MATGVKSIVNHFELFLKLQYEQRIAGSLMSVRESGFFSKQVGDEHT